MSLSVFVSYRHESQLHKKRVHCLVTRLRRQGIECHFDEDLFPPQLGLREWMDEHIKSDDYVLIVFSKNYAQGRGTAWEWDLIRQMIYNAHAKNNKFIPVVFSRKDIQYIPERAHNWLHYNLANRKERISLYTHLLRIGIKGRREFIGRQAKLKEVMESVVDGEHIATVIWGAPGCGKTALADEVKYQITLKNRFAHHIVFRPRGDSFSTEDIVDEFLGSTGRHTARSYKLEDKIGAAQEIMENKPCFLLCDNTESLASKERSAFLAFIAGLPDQSRMLITTRDRDLLWPDNQMLPSVKIVELGDMEDCEARELAEKAVNVLGLRSRVSDMDLISLVRACGGNPLAIKLSVSQLRYMLVAEVIKQLSSGNTELFERIFHRVWEQLSDLARAILCVIGLSGRLLSEDAIRHVVGGNLTRQSVDLHVLMDMALLALDPDIEGYFTIHPLIQAYALGHVDKVKKDAWRGKLAEYYRNLLQHAQCNLRTLEQAHQQMEIDLPNIIAALEWSFQERDSKLGSETLLATTRFLWNRGYWKELTTYASKALEVLEMPAEIRARLYCNVAWVCSRRGEFGEARVLLRKAKKHIYDSSSYEAGLISHVRGQIEYRLKHFRASENYLTKTLKIYDKHKGVDFDIARADIWDNLGDLYRNHGLWHLEKAGSRRAPRDKRDREKSKQCFNKSLRWYKKLLNLAQELGWKEKQATAAGDIGHVLMYLRRYENAEEHLKNGLELAERIHRAHTIAYANLGLGELNAVSCCRRTDAVTYLETALAEYTILGIDPTKKQIPGWIEFAKGKRNDQPAFVCY